MANRKSLDGTEKYVILRPKARATAGARGPKQPKEIKNRQTNRLLAHTTRTERVCPSNTKKK